MECTATLSSGRPCRRQAAADSKLCSFHHKVELRRQARAPALLHLSDAEEEALATAARLQGVDAEIAALRILIRRKFHLGDIEATRRGLDTLCRSLKVRHELDQASAERLTTTLERVLDTLGEELGVAL